MTNLSFRRFEFKYELPRAVTDRIIPQIMNYMEWDKYVGERDYYSVYSIYMDTRKFDAYHEKVDGIMNRKKARVRFYSRDVDDDSDLFFELKRKSGDVILKDRVIIKGRDAFKFLDDPFSLIRDGGYSDKFVNEFLYEYSLRCMQPVALVGYKRKPFFSKFDKRFRLTFDYDLEVGRVNDLNFNSDCARIFDDTVIMEVKFNGAMPKWFHEIIEQYSLLKGAFSKYCNAVDSIYGIPNYS